MRQCYWWIVVPLRLELPVTNIHICSLLFWKILHVETLRQLRFVCVWFVCFHKAVWSCKPNCNQCCMTSLNDIITFRCQMRSALTVSQQRLFKALRKWKISYCLLVRIITFETSSRLSTKCYVECCLYAIGCLRWAFKNSISWDHSLMHTAIPGELARHHQ